ncbi:MAG TPA: tRNA uridine-5-carboxymethylaminomethyl(34) synthesis GTPase MnmE [Treponemataceae bacterium]|nr:tRNA uridine-5-carboxymethylaminomethyl(34) synthesis GTPase MnmE [Treponemataceae bacterium]
MAYIPEEPIASIATALAPSALAIIRVSGTNCIHLVSNVFSRPKALQSAKGNTLIYGWILNPHANKAKIDEVMLAVYRAPKSYTGEDMVEIFCHGGVAPVKSVHTVLLQNGFREAERGEYTFRAFINAKTDLTRAEAVREIIESKTDISRGRAADRLSGALFEQIESIKQELVHTLSHLEAEIEYPEDENAISDAYNPVELIEIKKKLEHLSASWDAEKLYQDGAKIVLCGRTNAGKSSLFNTLLKQDRAIVSNIHGTTRDWIESWISFDGIPARLFDTAGLRTTKDSIEAIGVKRTKELAADADLVLYLLDSTLSIHEDDKIMLKELLDAKKSTPLIIVLNKTDKENSTSSIILDDYTNKPAAQLCISAKTGIGVSTLTAAVKKTLTAKLKAVDVQTGLGSERQKNAVDAALKSLYQAIRAPNEGLGNDAVVLDLEDAITTLGEITGDVSPDTILDNIFSQFCLGK